MIKAILLLFALPLGLLLAQDRSDAANQADGAATASAGKAVFQQNCSFCHGQDARGASGPDLIRSTLVSHDAGGDLIGQVVHNGRPDKGMPAFELPDLQILQIAAFLHLQAKLASTVASRVPSDYPLEQLLVGNAAAGQAYFNGAGQCAQCHSTSGDLAHVAARYRPLELQSRIVFPYGAKATASVTDSDGHSFTGKLVYADEFYVTLLVKGARHTWARGLAKVEIHDPLAGHVALLTKYTDKEIHDLFAYLESLQ
jgi:cytochrome c oxidase cbb3-type subunit III